MKRWHIVSIVSLFVVAIGAVVALWFHAESEGKKKYMESEHYKEMQKIIDESQESVKRSKEIMDLLGK